MYTVLIQSKKTMESFLRFYPLLSDTIEAGELTTCQWIKSGNTLETALPGLFDLIEKKNTWRAIILQTELDGVDEDNPTVGNNPYDFLENLDRQGLTIENGEIKDCKAPLIRLTHMLGGMPAPEKEFSEELEEDTEKIPRVVYKLVEEKEKNGITPTKAHRKWSEEHEMKAPPPQEIMIISAKYKPLAEDQYSNIENSWKHYTEAQSSAFWKRNLYPHNCRFLLFELDRHGKMREQRDYFKLWTAIVLLTVNPSDPDVLQAHRLYSLDVSFKKAELQQKLQESVDKLNKASYVLRKSLEKEEKKNMEENPELPKYRIGVPVSFALPRLSKLKFDTSQIPLAPDTDTEDLAVWNTYQRDASEELQLLIRSADRYLDQAAERLRYQSQYSEEEVYPLTSYQEEDLKNDLNTVYTGILRERELLPGGVTEAKRRTDSAEERVRERLLTRITAKEVATAVLLPVLLLLLSLAFGLINSKSLYWLPVLIAAAAAMLFVTACIILSLQKKALVNEIDAFQQTVQNTASEITQNSGVFSRFLSNISSHIHGKSFLDVMHARKMRRDNSYYLKVRNIKAINLLLNKIDLWSTALHAQVDLQSSQAMQYYDEDPDVDYDGLFSLQSVTRQPVPLNRSGSVVNAPFDFVDHLEIEREEVYECQTSPE